MTVNDRATRQKQLEAAISAQEQLRGIVADSIIDAAIAVLQKELIEHLSASREIEQQRKMVTVLFVDVVDSTRMIQDMDPEESMEVLDVSLQAIAEPIREHGGHVTRFMGDGFLAVFGLPTARENDPELAIHAALDILSVSEKISQSLKKERKIESFQVRIGINTGLIVSGGVTEADDTIMGSTINLAARLEKAAEPGTILISRHSYQHVRGIFDTEEQKPIDAKGFPEPVETYKILGIKPRAFRILNRGVEGVETRMIGRERELRHVQIISRKVIQEKVFRFVTVIGEAGMGKSRLLDEFETWLNVQPGQVSFFKGRANPEMQKQPYALFRNIFASHFDIMDDDAVQEVRKKLSNGFRQAIGDDDQIEMKAYLVGDLLGYDIGEDETIRKVFENPQLARDRVFQYLKTYLLAVAGQSPIMIFLDDIHWADESSLDLLDYLRESLLNTPVMVLALSRPLLFERRNEWGKGRNCETMEMFPLSGEQSEQLVLDILQKAENIPDAFCRTIVEHAEGNPFYLEELIRMLVEDGVILKEEPVWRIQMDQLVDLKIPPTLTGIIQARLEGLQKEEYVLLQQASVVGKVFWDDAITYMNQDHPRIRTSIPDHLESLLDKDMIFRRESTAFSGTTEYSYAHGIHRDVVYETVLLKQRRSYHNLVADWLIGRRGEVSVAISGVIAEHLVKAGRSDEAIDYFLQAAVAAAQKFANEEAIDLYQQALDLVPEKLMERQFSILLSLESLWNLIGNRDKQTAVLERLAHIADQLDDQHKQAEVLLRKAWYLFWTSNLSQMLNVAKSAITLADQLDSPSLAQEAFYALAWVQTQNEDPDNAKASAHRSLELARQTGYRLGEGNVHNVLGLIDLAQGRYVDAFGHIEEFLKVTQETDNQTRQLIALNSMFVVLVILGDYEKAWKYGIQQSELAVELGDRGAESTAYINLAWGASAQEDWQTAEEYAMKGLAVKREIRHLEALGEGLVWLGYAKLGLGQPKEAEQAFRESLEIRRGLGQEALQIESMAGLGQALLMGGDIAGAREYGEKIHAYISRDGDLSGTWEPLKIYWICYQILKAVGDTRKNDFLKDAIDNLQKRAEKITDKAAHERYLKNVPWHREIRAEWEGVQNNK